MKKVYAVGLWEGVHSWKDAPNYYLIHPHRHIFYWKVVVEVKGDREIEFINLKHQVEHHLNTYLRRLNLSCESYATYILQYLETLYPNRFIEVTVSEDNENGAIVDNSPSC